MGDENNTKAYVTMMMSTGQKITGKPQDILLCENTIGLSDYCYWLDRDKRFVVNAEHIIAIRPAREEEISEAQAHGG